MTRALIVIAAPGPSGVRLACRDVRDVFGPDSQFRKFGRQCQGFGSGIAASPGQSLPFGAMERNAKFEQSRFIGDKRTQLVYDLDSWEDPLVIDEIVDAGVALSFGPDTLPEARNRCYALATPWRHRRRRKPRS